MVHGAVTRTEFGPALFGSPSSCSGRGGGSPRPERFVSEDAKRAAGGEMALDVECVVDGGVNGQETLGGSGRFENAASCARAVVSADANSQPDCLRASPGHGEPTIRFRTLPRRKSAACPSPAHRAQSL